MNNQLTLTTEMSFGSLGQQALIDVRRQVSLAGFRRPSHLFLLSRRPGLAALLWVLALLQLLLPEVAAHHRVAMLVNAIGEVLAGHADHPALPVLQVALVDKIPLLHQPSIAVRLYYSRSEGIGNGFRLPL